jgi:hypothetical protein
MHLLLPVAVFLLIYDKGTHTNKHFASHSANGFPGQHAIAMEEAK